MGRSVGDESRRSAIISLMDLFEQMDADDIYRAQLLKELEYASEDIKFDMDSDTLEVAGVTIKLSTTPVKAIEDRHGIKLPDSFRHGKIYRGGDLIKQIMDGLCLSIPSWAKEIPVEWSVYQLEQHSDEVGH